MRKITTSILTANFILTLLLLALKGNSQSTYSDDDFNQIVKGEMKAHHGKMYPESFSITSDYDVKLICEVSPYRRHFEIVNNFNCKELQISFVSQLHTWVRTYAGTYFVYFRCCTSVSGRITNW